MQKSRKCRNLDESSKPAGNLKTLAKSLMLCFVEIVNNYVSKKGDFAQILFVQGTNWIVYPYLYCREMLRNVE